MSPVIPVAWQPIVGAETDKPYYQKLMLFLAEERQQHTVFPPENEVFSALELTPYEQVNVLLLGQDPYHDHNQAHGLCFSVRPGIKPPPSLQNVFKELKNDLGCRIPNNGYLAPWAKQGILLLNAVLTVRAHQAGSHRNKGWEKFTDRVIQTVNEKESPVVFVLWGNYAQQKIPADRYRQTRHRQSGAPLAVIGQQRLFRQPAIFQDQRRLTTGGQAGNRLADSGYLIR